MLNVQRQNHEKKKQFEYLANSREQRTIRKNEKKLSDIRRNKKLRNTYWTDDENVMYSHWTQWPKAQWQWRSFGIQLHCLFSKCDAFFYYFLYECDVHVNGGTQPGTWSSIYRLVFILFSLSSHQKHAAHVNSVVVVFNRNEYN